jgi:NADPH:quinone reductase-like Zn-dependent oxidoreductase
MWALQFEEYGGPEVIHLGEAPEPHARPGKIRITVKAASINGIDRKISSGLAAGGKPLEGTGYLGFDAAGVVDEIGDGVSGIAVGDDVFGCGSKTQAEFAVLDSWALKPASVDWSVAGAAGVAAEAAERTLRLLGVDSGSTLFIDGGAGGVGAVVTQFAVARGATVIASASQPNHDYLREIGAIPVLYGAGLIDRVRAVPVDRIDAVLDVAGKTPIEDLIAIAPEPAQVLSIANFKADEAGARVTGGSADSQPEKALAQAAELLQSGQLVIKVQTFPFSRAAEAYQQNQSGHIRGKVVLIPEH